MYESLLTLPYFQGMSKDDITKILDKVTFEFTKYTDGETIFKSGEKCDTFAILIHGELTATTEAPDRSFSLSEHIAAPHAIEPYSIFGYDTHYGREYKSKGNCAVLSIDKNFLFSELIKQKIFTINFLNLISHRAQILNRSIWEHTPSSIKGRIANFIAGRCETHHGRKILSIKMDCLASIICETRLNISKALNEIQESGLIELHRKEIVIPSLQRLTESYPD